MVQHPILLYNSNNIYFSNLYALLSDRFLYYTKPLNDFLVENKTKIALLLMYFKDYVLFGCIGLITIWLFFMLISQKAEDLRGINNYEAKNKGFLFNSISIIQSLPFFKFIYSFVTTYCSLMVLDWIYFRRMTYSNMIVSERHVFFLLGICLVLYYLVLARRKALLGTLLKVLVSITFFVIFMSFLYAKEEYISNTIYSVFLTISIFALCLFCIYLELKSAIMSEEKRQLIPYTNDYLMFYSPKMRMDDGLFNLYSMESTYYQLNKMFNNFFMNGSDSNYGRVENIYNSRTRNIPLNATENNFTSTRCIKEAKHDKDFGVVELRVSNENSDGVIKIGNENPHDVIKACNENSNGVIKACNENSNGVIKACNENPHDVIKTCNENSNSVKANLVEFDNRTEVKLDGQIEKDVDTFSCKKGELETAVKSLLNNETPKSSVIKNKVIKLQPLPAIVSDHIVSKGNDNKNNKNEELREIRSDTVVQTTYPAVSFPSRVNINSIKPSKIPVKTVSHKNTNESLLSKLKKRKAQRKARYNRALDRRFYTINEEFAGVDGKPIINIKPSKIPRPNPPIKTKFSTRLKDNKNSSIKNYMKETKSSSNRRKQKFIN